MSPKTGRPKSDNPKCINIKVRIDNEMNRKLVEYALKHNVSRTEVIRKGIKLVLDSDK